MSENMLGGGAPIKRAMFTYAFPEADQVTFDGRRMETITLAELTLAEEKQAAKLSGKDDLMELLMMASIKKINGQPVPMDGTLEGWFNQFRPRQRDLVIAAYQKLNVLKKDEKEDFLKGVVTSVE